LPKLTKTEALEEIRDTINLFEAQLRSFPGVDEFITFNALALAKISIVLNHAGFPTEEVDLHGTPLKNDNRECDAT